MTYSELLNYAKIALLVAIFSVPMLMLFGDRWFLKARKPFVRDLFALACVVVVCMLFIAAATLGGLIGAHQGVQP